MNESLQLSEFVPFYFKGIRLRESCWIGETPCCSGRAIGEWLKVKHPDRYVHKIVERNPHIKNFSKLLKLTVVDEVPTQYHQDGKKCSLVSLTSEHSPRIREIEVRVYDPIGLQLIIMESRQPKAIQYKIAVAHLVWAYMNGKLKSPKHRIEKMARAVEGLQQIEATFRLGQRGQFVEQLSEKIGVTRATLYRWRRRLRETGTLKYNYADSWGARRARDFLPKWACVWGMLEKGLKPKDIPALLGVGIAMVYRVRRMIRGGVCLSM